MWGYRQPRRSGYGINLSKMLSFLIFFLLMALISSAGIPTMLMANRPAPKQAKVFHTNTQLAKALVIHPTNQTRKIHYQAPVFAKKAPMAAEKESKQTLGI